MNNIKQAASGSTFAEISKKTFRPFPIIVPTLKILELFIGQASPVYTKISLNAKESRTLADLRDTLLPKLLSGELSVVATQSQTEKALA